MDKTVAIKPVLGEHAVSYCTKCKLELGHTIIALTGNKIARVKCRTCNSEHNHKDKSKKRVTAKKSTSSVKKTASANDREAQWVLAMTNAQGSDIPYDMAREFRVNEPVLHKTFGRGLVLIVSEKKVTIIFKDKERILVSSN